MNPSSVTNTEGQGPTGQITLVFTDVKESVKMWENDSKAMAEGIKLQHACMRTGICKHDGFEVKTEGEAFMIAFKSAKDAVAFCLKTQEDLLDIRYSNNLLTQEPARHETDNSGTTIWNGPRVAMGVHTGTPASELDPTTNRTDYFGKMVNEAARIGGQANGGQIKVSKATLDQIGDLESLGNPTTKNLGPVSLKGISESIVIHEVVSERLRNRVFE